MREFHIIKKEFSFLTTQYGFKINYVQTSGSYCFVDWTNSKTNIKVMYDKADEKPVSIFTYNADSLGTIADVTVYQNELVALTIKPEACIHHAAEWLKRAIENKTIVI